MVEFKSDGFCAHTSFHPTTTVKRRLNNDHDNDRRVKAAIQTSQAIQYMHGSDSPRGVKRKSKWSKGHGLTMELIFQSILMSYIKWYIYFLNLHPGIFSWVIELHTHKSPFVIKWLYSICMWVSYVAQASVCQMLFPTTQYNFTDSHDIRDIQSCRHPPFKGIVLLAIDRCDKSHLLLDCCRVRTVLK